MKKPEPASLLALQPAGPGAPAAEPPVLDLERALEICDHDWTIVRPVIAVFVADAPRRLQSLRIDGAEGQHEAVQRGAHSLKSAARMVGGLRLAAAAQRLEIELARHSEAPLDTWIAELAEELERLLAALAADPRLR